LTPQSLTPTISAPRHPTKPENTKALRGAGALDRVVRPICWLKMLGFASSPQPTALTSPESARTAC
jgi:hypothetical protein